jgi:hypothetical protein
LETGKTHGLIMPAGGPGSRGGKINGPIGREGPMLIGFGMGEAVEECEATIGTGLVKTSGVLLMIPVDGDQIWRDGFWEGCTIGVAVENWGIGKGKLLARKLIN